MATRYKGNTKQIRALDVYIKLLRATQSLGQRVDRHQTTGDLTDSQFGALEAVYHLGPLSQKQVGEKLLVSKSNVVAIVDALEDRGLVERQQDLEDRRCTNICLTDDGQDLIEQLLPVHVEAIVEELSCLSAAEQQELARLCRKVGRGQTNGNDKIK